MNGNLQANNVSGSGDPMSSGANVICNTTVKGNLQVHGSDSDSPWHIGACGPDSVGGNLQFQQNGGTGNTIYGDDRGGQPAVRPQRRRQREREHGRRQPKQWQVCATA